MANSLLDFVMALVRDPDAAARYAADPQQAIADANLTGVTSADVDNLIPVVTESIPVGGVAGGGLFGGADPGAEAAGNVWASGAATAAFDAFAAPLPEPVPHSPVLHDPVISDGWTAPVIDAPAPTPDEADLVAPPTPQDDVSLQLVPVSGVDEPVLDAPVLDDWTGVASDPEPLDDADPGFDFFN